MSSEQVEPTIDDCYRYLESKADFPDGVQIDRKRTPLGPSEVGRIRKAIRQEAQDER